MSDPWKEDSGVISVSFKSDKGYDATMVKVSAGSVAYVRELVMAYFGYESASVADLTLHELVVNATELTHGVNAAAAGLGGKAISAQQAAETPKNDPWSQAQAGAQKPGEDAPAPIYGLIEAATSTDVLKRLWAEHQATGEFSDPKVMEAWKAKGKTLKAAA